MYRKFWSGHFVFDRNIFALGILILWLLASINVCAETPTDEELLELEQQIEQQEQEQAEAKKRAEAKAKHQAEEEAKLKAEEEARRQAEEEARIHAEAEAQRKAGEEKQRLQLEQQQREKFDKVMAGADAAMSKNDFSLAVESYAHALEIFPDDVAALAGHARAQNFQEVCAALTGEWDWIFGSVAIVNANGTLQGVSIIPNHGTWECTDPSQRKFTLRWVVGGWVDNLILSNDSNIVDVTNNIGTKFQGHRKGSQKPAPAANPLFGH